MKTHCWSKIKMSQPDARRIGYILNPADVHGPDFPGETFRVLKGNRQIRRIQHPPPRPGGVG